MKRQIHAYRGHDEIAVAGHNIKIGRGGIREIEFFVQTQQLIAGGRHAALRRRGTVAMRVEGRPYTTIERTLVQRMTEVISQTIQRPARSEWHDECDRPRRISLRPSDARDGWERGGAGGQMQKLSSAGKFQIRHDLLQALGRVARPRDVME